MNIALYLKKNFSAVSLIALSFFFFLLRLPSIFEPSWYGDEGIYEVIGFALRHKRALYSGIWDNKPPLLYIIDSFFDGNQPAVRFFSIVIGILAVVSFFFLAKKLFRKEPAVYIATTLFALFFALPFFEGNIANAENFMLFPIIAAGFFTFGYISKHSLHIHEVKNKLFLPGLLLGIAFLIKIVAVFDFAAFFLFVLFVTYKHIKEIKQQMVLLLPFVVGFVIPLVVTALYFLFQGTFSIFIHSAFLSNVGYVAYGNQFIIPQGLLLVKLLLLGVFSLVIFLKRHALSQTKIFIFLWIAFSLFNMFFSQRPYTHYILVLIPSFMLFATLFFEETNKRIKAVVLITTVLLIHFVFSNFNLHEDTFFRKTTNYYANFLSFVRNTKSVTSYYAFFDGATPRDYALAQFINSQKTSSHSLFIWGNNAQVYRLTNTLPPGRFMVAYHIISTKENLQETANALTKEKPQFVLVDLSMYPTIPYSLKTYRIQYVIGTFAIYEKIL